MNQQDARGNFRAWHTGGGSEGGIDTGGKQAAQCQAAIGKANQVLGCIWREITYKSKEVVLTLYRNLVRATSRILCAVLVTTVPEGHRCDREGSAQGY